MEKRKKKIRIKWSMVLLYIFIILTLWLAIANYEIQSECIWDGTADSYVTKLTLVRK